MAFGLWAKNHIGPNADKGGSGGSALPAIEKLEIDWDGGKFADTWQEVKDKLNSGKLLFAVSTYDDTPEVWIVAGTSVHGTSYEVHMIDLAQLTGDAGHYAWVTDSPNGHPHNDD